MMGKSAQTNPHFPDGVSSTEPDNPCSDAGKHTTNCGGTVEPSQENDPELDSSKSEKRTAPVDTLAPSLKRFKMDATKQPHNAPIQVQPETDILERAHQMFSTLARSAWTKQEDEILSAAVKEMGPRGWSQIA